MQNGAHSVPVVDPGPADGVFSLLWLVIALPLLGALVILVGGPLTKGRIGSWAHRLGCAGQWKTCAGESAATLKATLLPNPAPS